MVPFKSCCKQWAISYYFWSFVFTKLAASKAILHGNGAHRKSWAGVSISLLVLNQPSISGSFTAIKKCHLASLSHGLWVTSWRWQRRERSDSCFSGEAPQQTIWGTASLKPYQDFWLLLKVAASELPPPIRTVAAVSELSNKLVLFPKQTHPLKTKCISTENLKRKPNIYENLRTQ